MCGICGQVNRDADRPVDGRILRSMNAVVQHRGPDSDGFYLAGNVGLAVRRLAVIDLVTGDQPLSNENNTVWIVFNGEVYNYPELRVQLEQRGHRFRTQTDTEAVVHLYEDYGPECVHHLRGMFAFAIWDTELQRLLLVRDRIGKKPLFYGEHDDALLFGSEIKCILQYPHLERVVDLEAIHHYLTLQYVPDPWTAFKGIRELPPAHRLLWQNGRATLECYWDLDYEPKWDQPEPLLKEQLRELITDAVRLRLVSDVPLGAHLSGGIDSSIIVGLMASLMSQPVKTFSIGFSVEGFSELPYARQVAEKFDTDHHEFILEPDVLSILPKLVEHFDEPFADPAAIPTWCLAEMTRRHVTVALNGDGGDEAFAGYQRYYGDRIADAYRMVPAAIRHGVFDRVLRILPIGVNTPMERNTLMALRQLAQAAEMSHEASIARWGGYFTEQDKYRLYTEDMRQALNGTESAAILMRSFREARAKGRVDRTLYTDVHNYLPGALLPKVDRTTMAHSLEARSPFLDHKVLEFAARLPQSWKLRGRETKRILRQVFAELLPPPVAKRGKVGFGVPLTLWFRGPLAGAAEELLLGAGARSRRYLRQDAVARLLEENRRGAGDHGKRIWSLLNLEMWLEKYKAQ